MRTVSELLEIFESMLGDGYSITFDAINRSKPGSEFHFRMTPKAKFEAELVDRSNTCYPYAKAIHGRKKRSIPACKRIGISILRVVETVPGHIDVTFKYFDKPGCEGCVISRKRVTWRWRAATPKSRWTCKHPKDMLRVLTFLKTRGESASNEEVMRILRSGRNINCKTIEADLPCMKLGAIVSQDNDSCGVPLDRKAFEHSLQWLNSLEGIPPLDRRSK